MTEKIYTKLAEQGVLFLVMGGIIWILYINVKEEIVILRKETTECSQSYKDLLINQLNKNTHQLERNNDHLIENNRILAEIKNKAR